MHIRPIPPKISAYFPIFLPRKCPDSVPIKTIVNVAHAMEIAAVSMLWSTNERLIPTAKASILVAMAARARSFGVFVEVLLGSASSLLKKASIINFMPMVASMPKAIQ